jgi:hypothetical protein
MEDPLAEEMLQKKFESGGSIYVTFDESLKKLVFSPKPIAKVGR